METNRKNGTAASQILSPSNKSLSTRTRPAIPAAPPSRSLLLEEEDASLTGTTRSLQRRLIGLNLPMGKKGNAVKAA